MPPRVAGYCPGAWLGESHVVQFESDSHLEIRRFFMFGISMTT